MGAGPLSRIPPEERTIRRSHFEELRAALVGDQLPRGDGLILPEGSVAPAAGSIGTPQNPYGDIYARDFLLPDGTSIQAASTPQFPDPRPIASPPVPGENLGGSCGQLRFSDDDSFLYAATGTLVAIEFERFSIGYAAHEDIPTAARVSSQPSYAGNSVAEIKRQTLFGDAWWFDKDGVHSPLAAGDADANGVYGVFANAQSRLFLATFSPYGGITPGALLTDTAIAPVNSVSHVVEDGQWYLREAAGWVKSDYVPLGAVAFKNGAISKVFCIRTSLFALAAAAAIPAAAIVGVETGFGDAAAAAYAGSVTPYFRARNNQFSVWSSTQPSLAADRIAGGGTFQTSHVASARPRDLDHLFYGVTGLYGWANNEGDTLVTALNGVPGTHAYLPAQVILTATFTGANNNSVRFVPGYFDGNGTDDEIPRYPSF